MKITHTFVRIFCCLFVACSIAQSSHKPEIVKVKVEGSWYWLGIPKIQNKKLPMVIALHGDEGHPNNMKKFWESIWEKRGDFVFVAPECPRGLCDKGGVNTWSAGGYINSKRQGIWLKKLIAALVSKYTFIDTDRIFAVGYSGGSIFFGLPKF